jgi:hypothetical protein
MLHLIAVSYWKMDWLSRVTQYPEKEPLPELYSTGTVEGSCSNFSMKEPSLEMRSSVRISVML